MRMISTLLILTLILLTDAIPFRGPVHSRFQYLKDEENLNSESHPESDVDIQLLDEDSQFRKHEHMTSHSDDSFELTDPTTEEHTPDDSPPHFSDDDIDIEKKIPKIEDSEEKKISRVKLHRVFSPTQDDKNSEFLAFDPQRQSASTKDDELEFTIREWQRKSQKKDLSHDYIDRSIMNPSDRYPFSEDVGIIPKEVAMASFVQHESPTFLDFEDTPINSKWPRYFEEAFFPISPFPEMYDYRIIGTEFKKGIISSPDSTHKKVFPAVLDREVKDESPFQGGPQLYQSSTMEKHLRQPINPSSVSLVLSNKEQSNSHSAVTTTPRNFVIKNR